jgi:tRNA (guanine37-N1)-methyltransferase
MLKITFLSLFPDALRYGLQFSLIEKAIQQNKVQVNFVNIRDFAKDRHRTTDDTLYGGGPGMLLKPDVLFDAWSSVTSLEEKSKPKNVRPYTVLLSPQGKLFSQQWAKSWMQNHDFAAPAEAHHLILVCGHYEGIDERFIDLCVDEELSIGDYVLTGGELPALVISDVMIRLLPAVVGNEDSIIQDSLENGLLKYPQFTKPRDFQGRLVPEVLLSGNHAKIMDWRKQQSETRTQQKRPDLWALIQKKSRP